MEVGQLTGSDADPPQALQPYTHDRVPTERSRCANPARYEQGKQGL